MPPHCKIKDSTGQKQGPRNNGTNADHTILRKRKAWTYKGHPKCTPTQPPNLGPIWHEICQRVAIENITRYVAPVVPGDNTTLHQNHIDTELGFTQIGDAK